MSEFYVGQKVVCVDDKPNGPIDVLVRRGNEYVVRELCPDFDGICFNGCRFSIKLVGIRRELDTPLAAIRFRPLESKAVGLFRAIAQGVTDGNPIIPDEEHECEKAFMYLGSLGGYAG